MSRVLLPMKLLLAVLLAACVTVNVYFPAAAAQTAADQIIDQITNQPAPQNAPSSSGTATPPQGSVAPTTTTPVARLARDQAPAAWVVALGTVLEALVPAAHAQSQANLDINTPEIRAVTASMQARYAQLKPFFDSGAIGLTADGHVDVRDANAAPLAERANIRRLVAEENRDRDTLYTEIAKANGHPEWRADIQSTFARRWIERAPGGTWFQEGGAWKQK